MFSKLKQFKDLRHQAKTMESQLATVTSEGEAAWGKVKMTLDGNHKLIAVAIDPTFLSDKTKLEAAMVEAHADAGKKMQFKLAKKIQEMGGMDMLKKMGG